MSRFLEKFAKLTTDIEDNGGEFTINVYDDELDTTKPIMYLYGMEINSEDLNPNSSYHGVVVYVESINFDNELFFKLPQERQDKCGVVLLLRFNRFYKEQYEDCAIGAEFLNYELQEKFKKGIENGSYPEESLDFIKETTSEQWDKEKTYNLDNRKKLNDIKNNPNEYFESLNLNFENGFFVNEPISNILNAFDESKTPVSPNLFGKIQNGNVYITHELINDFYSIDTNSRFSYYNSTKKIVSPSSNMGELISQSENNMRIVFDNIQYYQIRNETYAPEEFYELKNLKEASNNTRLKKDR